MIKKFYSKKQKNQKQTKKSEMIVKSKRVIIERHFAANTLFDYFAIELQCSYYTLPFLSSHAKRSSCK